MRAGDQARGTLSYQVSVKDAVSWELGEAGTNEGHSSQGGQSPKDQKVACEVSAVERSDTMRARTCHWVQAAEGHGFHGKKGSVRCLDCRKRSLSGSRRRHEVRLYS